MASRRRESRVERKPVAAFSAGFSLALKEGGTLVKNCRSRGTSREGSRFFRRLGRVTSSSDPRDHCLRSLPASVRCLPPHAIRLSNGRPRSLDVEWLEGRIWRNQRMMDTIGGRGRVEFVNGNREGGFEDSQLSELLFEFSLPPPYSRKQCDNFNFKIIWNGNILRVLDPLLE